MADSSIVIKQLHLESINLDSISQQLTTLQNTISNAKSNNHSFSIWIPLIASIIGGLLVWAGQAIERNRKRKTERKNNLLEIYSYCRKLESLMKNNYRELAMAKSHVEYWWHVANSPSSNPTQMVKGYDEHLRSQVYARETERKIGDTKAEFIGHVRKFQAICPINEDVENYLEEISDLINAKAKNYDFSIPHEQVRYNVYDRDEKELREIYYKNLKPFKEINDILQSFLTAK